MEVGGRVAPVAAFLFDDHPEPHLCRYYLSDDA
jgi:hypothetical protein